jgi:phenylpropionate dioxygenase-like ring-hydroxylating dioxygenase large terminal subunit
MATTSTEQTAQGTVPERWALGESFVPKGRYVDRDFARLELDELFTKTWQVACREEDLVGPGAFHEYTIGDQSILVIRQDDGSLRAMHNACRHRGMKLIGGAGRVEELRCRFHGFRYALDGTSTFRFCAEEFEACPESEWALAPVHVDTWGGFVFVNLDVAAPPLLDFLAPLPELLAPYHLEQLRLRAYQSTILPANWKAVVDAFNEAYHVQTTHPQLLPWTDDVSIAYETLGIHAHYGRLPSARRQLRPSPRLGLRPGDYDEGEILTGLVAGLGRLFLKDELALVDEVRSTPPSPGDDGSLLERFQRRRRALLAARGLDVSGLTLDQMTSADDVFWFPNVVGPLYPGSAVVFRVRPNGLDPDSAIKDIWTLEWPPPDAPDAKWERRFYPDWRDKDWGEISNQDYANMAEVQAGMKSRGFTGSRLNPRQESNVLHMHRMIDRYLTAG